jgi:hypothetical protein
MKTIFTLLSTLLITLTYGQTLEWVDNYGGTEWDSGRGIAIDQSGNTYTIGAFKDTITFVTSNLNETFISNGGNDIFIQKYNSNGDLQWVKQIGGDAQDAANGITVDNNNNVIIVGEFTSTVDFDPGMNTNLITSTTLSGIYDAFVLKLDTDGDFVWVKIFAGTSSSSGTSVVTDNNNNIYTLGYYFDTVDFDPNAGTSNLTSIVYRDIFISKLTENGDYVWAETEGGSNFDRPKEIKIKGDFLYICGEFQDVADLDPTAGIQNFTSNGGYDMFVQKIDLDGNYIWTKTIGSASDIDWAESVDIDGYGNVYLAGGFADTLDFNPTGGGAIEISAGSSDSFVAKYDSNGNFIWVKTMQGPAFDQVMSINVSDIGDVYITGMFTDSVDFDPSGIELWAYTDDFEDIFIEKLNSNGDFVWLRTFGGNYTDFVLDAVIDNNQNIYMTGFTRNTVDFDPNSGVVEYTSVTPKADYYVLKFAAYTVDINENSFESSNIAQLYPNPTSGKFTINLNDTNTKTQIQIVDLTGKVVFENSYQNQSNIQLNLDAPNGIYFVKVMENGNQSVVKLIKQ